MSNDFFKKEMSSDNRKRQQKLQKLKFEDTGLVKYGPNDSTEGPVTEERLMAIWDDLIKYYELWLAYPDKLVELLLPPTTAFKLHPFQIVALRINFRYRRVSQTSTRGFSKSFIAFLTKLLKGILLPGNKETIVSEGKNQAAQIAMEKTSELIRLMPLLDNEINREHGGGTVGGQSGDYMRIVFKNGAWLDVSGLTNSTRGGRRHGKNICHFMILPFYKRGY